MHESDADLALLQERLDFSYAKAGRHLLSIHTAERRLDAPTLSQQLQGMCLLALATVTADNRPINGPVDGVFYRGEFYFGSAPDSLRVRHIRARPQVSAVHLPGETLAVTVHGRAIAIDLRGANAQQFRETLLSIYVPRYGPEWEQFIESGVTYLRIAAERIFAFGMQEAGST